MPREFLYIIEMANVFKYKNLLSLVSYNLNIILNNKTRVLSSHAQ